MAGLRSWAFILLAGALALVGYAQPAGRLHELREPLAWFFLGGVGGRTLAAAFDRWRLGRRG